MLRPTVGHSAPPLGRSCEKKKIHFCRLEPQKRRKKACVSLLSGALQRVRGVRSAEKGTRTQPWGKNAPRSRGRSWRRTHLARRRARASPRGSLGPRTRSASFFLFFCPFVVFLVRFVPPSPGFFSLRIPTHHDRFSTLSPWSARRTPMWSRQSPSLARHWHGASSSRAPRSMYTQAQPLRERNN